MKKSKWFLLGVLLLVAEQAEAKYLILEQTILQQTWEFVSSEPSSNVTLNAPPASITVTFSQAVKPTGSFIKVYDPYNNPIGVGDISVKNTGMSVPLPSFKPGYNGTYRVEWQAACQCTDTKLLNASFYFTLQ